MVSVIFVSAHLSGSADNRRYRGTVKIIMKQYQAAVKDFSRAIDIDNKNIFAYDSRGTVYMEYFNDKQKACADWERSCELGNCRNYQLAKKRAFAIETE